MWPWFGRPDDDGGGRQALSVRRRCGTTVFRSKSADIEHGKFSPTPDVCVALHAGRPCSASKERGERRSAGGPADRGVCRRHRCTCPTPCRSVDPKGGVLRAVCQTGPPARPVASSRQQATGAGSWPGRGSHPVIPVLLSFLIVRLRQRCFAVRTANA